MQWGSGLSTFAVNRRENPSNKVSEWRDGGTLKGPVDHDVPVLSVRDPEDATLRAVLFGYACHATTLSGLQWCGDYPGYAQIAIEKEHPGCVALFWAARLRKSRRVLERKQEQQHCSHDPRKQNGKGVGSGVTHR